MARLIAQRFVVLLLFSVYMLESNGIMSKRSFLIRAISLGPIAFDARLALSSFDVKNDGLGVQNGLLAECGTVSCSSSQDDAAGDGRCFAEPWEYDGSIDKAFSSILGLLSVKTPGEPCTIVAVEDTKTYKYIRVTYSSIGNNVDDVEFYLPGIS